MAAYGLVVRFEIKPGHEEAFDELVNRTLAGISTSEPGTLAYASHTVEGAASARIFYELYRDREAFAEHERQRHTRAFLEARQLHVASHTVDVLHLVDGLGTGPTGR